MDRFEELVTLTPDLDRPATSDGEIVQAPPCLVQFGEKQKRYRMGPTRRLKLRGSAEEAEENGRR